MIFAIVALLPFVAEAAKAADDSTSPPAASTCGDLRDVYANAGCCGMPSKSSGHQVVPMPEMKMFQVNPCKGKKPYDASPGDGYFNNVKCTSKDGVLQALEQSGTNVTVGYKG